MAKVQDIIYSASEGGLSPVRQWKTGTKETTCVVQCRGVPDGLEFSACVPAPDCCTMSITIGVENHMFMSDDHAKALTRCVFDVFKSFGLNENTEFELV